MMETHKYTKHFIKTRILIGFAAVGHLFYTAYYLFELFLQGGRQVLGNTKGFHGNIDSGNALWYCTSGAKRRNTFLHRDIIGILAEEVRHGTRVTSHKLKK